MELLTFSNVLERSGSLLTENAAVVAEGRISVRDEKAPQLVVNRFDPLESFTKQASAAHGRRAAPAAQEQAVLQASRLYLRLPSEQSPLFGKVRATPQHVPRQCGGRPVFCGYGRPPRHTVRPARRYAAGAARPAR